MRKITLIIVLNFFGYIYGQTYEYQIKNLGLNTQYSDFGSFTGNDKFIYASAKPQDNKSSSNWENNQPHLDLFYGATDGSIEPKEIFEFSDQINTKYHESNVAISQDGNTIYFTRSNYFNNKYYKDKKGWNRLKMFKATLDSDGKWTNIEPLPFNNDEYSTGHPTLSPDEKYLYFVSDMPGGYGETDIYKVELLSDGSVGSPENLGTRINSFGKEMFPFIDKDNTLYYSSDARGSMGGLDVFSASLVDTSVEPSRLSEPINSKFDDFSYSINPENLRGYFSSNRPGGKGDDDIYFFEMSKAEALKKCKQSVVGKVLDSKTNQILPNSKVSLYRDYELLETVTVSENAEFKFDDLDCNASYKVSANKEDYNGSEQKFLTTDKPNKDVMVDLNLMPMKVNRIAEEYDQCQQALNEVGTIYFDLDRDYIRPDAADKLEEVVRIMTECKYIVIIATAHTDSRGSDKYNLDLSQRRAQSMVNYIVKRGIERSRVYAMGYGETQLLNKCGNMVKCSEDEHSINRRTEFKVIK